MSNSGNSSSTPDTRSDQRKPCAFGWKRKLNEAVDSKTSKTFKEESKDSEDEEVTSGKIDWLSLRPDRKIPALEDANVKCSRLIEESAILASNERYWEAIRKFDIALTYNAEEGKIHEMKAQVYMELNEVYPAVTSAERAVRCDPRWWVAHQTLGRARLALGEVRLATRAFATAIHLQPDEKEVWEEDIPWVLQILEKKRKIAQERTMTLDKPESSDSTSSVQATQSEENSDRLSNSDIYIRDIV